MKREQISWRTHLKLRRSLNLRQVEVDGVHCAIHQEGRGEDLVLLSSPLIRAATYMPAVQALSSHFRVTVIELPGSANAHHLRRPWNFEQYALYTRRLCERLRLSRPILIGHSNSGPIALLTAQGLAQGFRALVLVDSVGAHSSESLFPIILSRLRDAVLEPHLTLTGTHHILGNLVSHTQNFLFQVKLCSGAKFLKQVSPSKLPPVLLAWGARDQTMPRPCFEKWHQSCFVFASYMSRSGSHDWIITHPREFAAFLGAAVTQLNSRRPE